MHGIVKGHNGTITIDSTLETGTTFSIYLPQNKPLPDATEKPKTQSAPRGKASIFLVDDEAALTRLGTLMLEPLGYHVAAWTDSVEALQAFESDPMAFDLAILDQMMPKMTGVELAKRIKDTRDDIPIILCSGFDQEFTAEQFQEIGVEDFIVKPIERNHLATVVHRILKNQNK